MTLGKDEILGPPSCVEHKGLGGKTFVRIGAGSLTTRS